MNVQLLLLTNIADRVTSCNLVYRPDPGGLGRVQTDATRSDHQGINSLISIKLDAPSWSRQSGRYDRNKSVLSLEVTPGRS